MNTLIYKSLLKINGMQKHLFSKLPENLTFVNRNLKKTTWNL